MIFGPEVVEAPFEAWSTVAVLLLLVLLALPWLRRSRWSRWEPALLLGGCLCGALAWGMAAQGEPGAAILLIPLALVGMVVAVRRLDRTGDTGPLLPAGALPILTGLIALALLGLRLHHFCTHPEGVAVDEAVKASVAIDILEGKQKFQPFMQYRESPYFYLVALSFRLFGLSQGALRLPALLIGILTLAAAYRLMRRLFGPEVGAASLLCLGCSFWHLVLCRSSERLVLVPLFQLLVLLLAESAGRRGSLLRYAALGATLSVGMFSYPPARLLPLMALAALAPRWFERPRNWKRHLAGIGLALLAGAILLALPFGGHLGDAIRSFTSTEPLGYSAPIRLEGPRPLAANLGVLVRTWYHRTAARGTIRPFNHQQIPLLHPGLGVLMLIGLATTLARIRRYPYRLLLTTLIIGLLPGLPVAALERRLILVTLVLLLLAGLGLITLGRGFASVGPHHNRRRPALGALAILATWLLLASGGRLIHRLEPFPDHRDRCAPYRDLVRLRLEGPVMVVAEFFHQDTYSYFLHRDGTGLIGPGHEHHRGILERTSAEILTEPFLEEPDRIWTLRLWNPRYEEVIRRLDRLLPEARVEICRDREGEELSRIYRRKAPVDPEESAGASIAVPAAST